MPRKPGEFRRRGEDDRGNPGQAHQRAQTNQSVPFRAGRRGRQHRCVTTCGWNGGATRIGTAGAPLADLGSRTQGRVWGPQRLHDDRRARANPKTKGLAEGLLRWRRRPERQDPAVDAPAALGPRQETRGVDIEAPAALHPHSRPFREAVALRTILSGCRLRARPMARRPSVDWTKRCGASREDARPSSWHHGMERGIRRRDARRDATDSAVTIPRGMTPASNPMSAIR